MNDYCTQHKAKLVLHSCFLSHNIDQTVKGSG